MHMHDNTEVRPQQLDYRGLNHSRMTASHATALRDMPAAFMALEKLRRLVGDDNTIHLYGGVRGWARWMDCSPGYPKAILNRLAQEGFIQVVYLDDGFAEVTVLPPPELGADQRRPARCSADQRDAAPTSEPQRNAAQCSEPQRNAAPGSPVDPLVISSLQPCHSAGTPGRSIGDRMSHESCSMQQQQQGASFSRFSLLGNTPRSPAPQPAVPRPPDPARPDLAFPAAWAAIRQANPTYSAADFARDMAAAQARADIKNPVGLVVTCARRGEPVYSPADLKQRAPTRPTPAAAPPDPRRRTHGTRRDDAVPNVTYTAEDEARCRDDYACARALVAALAPDADELQVAYVMLDLQNGVDEETAQANARVRLLAGGAV